MEETKQEIESLMRRVQELEVMLAITRKTIELLKQRLEEK